MEGLSDGERVAASLAQWLAGVTFADLGADEVTDLLASAVVAWARGQGWRAYRRAPSVLPLPPPYEHRHSWIDVGCARPAGAPIAVELDRSDRRRTVDKLLAEAEAGRVAIWLRWGTGPFAEPPEPVRMVTVAVTARRGGALRYSRQPVRERPAPAHTEAPPTTGEQADLFGGAAER
ncbi:hypothetical protein [Phytohabitans houttuyneae]|jgi:hypothetical protein|uniref:Uncharacterized protein n=1 Tax=Phytohabitans houttuyneae TaxID=1076126 RepID=A0A6V8K3B2_9ACTN|nr:hypothetical protein [Phytohabitans houttuyneae]GFJ76287.1 hypothetical protein Phou_004670 [Phytohabitans houttuyneae]